MALAGAHWAQARLEAGTPLLASTALRMPVLQLDIAFDGEIKLQ